MNETVGYLLGAIGALTATVLVLFKLLIGTMKENRTQSEIMTRELTKNTMVVENNTKQMKDNKQLFDKVMDFVNKASKK